MMLGKRQRSHMKRTTSLSEITFDLNAPVDAQPPDPCRPEHLAVPNGWEQPLLLAASPRVGRRHSADFLETPNFLRSCSLCKRRLVPGCDIYMYRGDSAFCSLECRQQQINQDERKDKKKFSLAAWLPRPPAPGSPLKGRLSLLFEPRHPSPETRSSATNIIL